MVNHLFERKSWGTILVLIMMVIWIAFGIVPFLLPGIPSATISLLSVSFSAATALFTGTAFVVALFNLYKYQENINEQQENYIIQQKNLEKQQDTLIKQINLSVFSDSMKFVMDSDKYNQCREYIYSNNFTDDVSEVKKILGQEIISLDDYRRANQSLSRTEENNESDKDMKRRLYDSYEKIKFFCMRMEFLGVVVSRENAAEALIIDYYGPTITDTYERLKSLIEATRANKDSANLYMYYTELYNKVKTKKKEHK